MNRRTLASIAFALLLLAGAWFVWHRDRTARTEPPLPGASQPSAALENRTLASSNPAPARPGIPPSTPIVLGQIPHDNQILPPGPPPPEGLRAVAMQQLAKINNMLRDYRTLMGTNPVGTNAEIMSSIMGGNPKKARLGPPEGMPLDASGELVDPWGTPFFFHQLSGTQTEVRSAGPDKLLWTGDDITWK